MPYYLYQKKHREFLDKQAQDGPAAEFVVSFSESQPRVLSSLQKESIHYTVKWETILETVFLEKSMGYSPWHFQSLAYSLDGHYISKYLLYFFHLEYQHQVHIQTLIQS